MDRRAFLRRHALLAAAPIATASAGCAGGGDADGTPGARLPDGGTPPDSNDDLEVRDFDYEEAPDGSLVVSVAVENAASGERTATLTVDVTVDGESTTRSREIRIGGGESVGYDVEFDVAMEAFRQGGAVSIELD